MSTIGSLSRTSTAAPSSAAGETVRQDELAGYAADATVVHLTGTETINGTKTFGSAPLVPVGGDLANPVRRDDARLTDERAPLAALANVADGWVRLDGGIKIPQNLLPAIALTEYLGGVASQAAMLALVGQRGDWCTRTDLGVDYQLIAEPSTTLASWRAMTYPASPVASVNGRTGVVTGLAEQSSLDAHTAAADPHSQYLLPAEATAAYAPIAAALPTGGTAGQYLRKSSATNYDDTWATLAQMRTDLAAPVFQALQTVAQAISNGIPAEITFTTEEIDSGNGHSTNTNTNRYTPTVAGWYLVSGMVVTNGTTAVRVTSIYKNGAEIPGSQALLLANTLGDNRVPTAARLVFCNGTTDYLSLGCYAEAACSTRVDGTRGSVLTAVWIRP